MPARTTTPELRVLDALSEETPAHWSSVARDLHLRVGSAQQYLSRLSRQGLVRRVSAGWYVRASLQARPAWRASTRERDILTLLPGLSALWSSSHFSAFASLQGALPGFTHVSVVRDDLSSADRTLTRAGFSVHLDEIESWDASCVLLRSSSEVTLRDETTRLATTDRAWVDLAIEVLRTKIDVTEDVVISIGTQLYARQMLNLTHVRRYATRRYAEDGVLRLLREALPAEERRALRSVIGG